MGRPPQPRSAMNSDQWCSPPIITEPLAQFFGGPVGTDPCSNERSIVQANVALHAGGLHLPWWTPRAVHRTCFENYPYSRPGPWTEKMLTEIETNLEEHVRLGPVSTSTLWWRRQCGVEGKYKDRPPNPRLLFTGRLKFIGDVDLGARFDSALVYYGRHVAAFEREFKHVTKWSSWGRA